MLAPAELIKFERGVDPVAGIDNQSRIVYHAAGALLSARVARFRVVRIWQRKVEAVGVRLLAEAVDEIEDEEIAAAIVSRLEGWLARRR